MLWNVKHADGRSNVRELSENWDPEDKLFFFKCTVNCTTYHLLQKYIKLALCDLNYDKTIITITVVLCERFLALAENYLTKTLNY